MARPALGRRRGTKSKSGGWFGIHPLLKGIVIGMGLIAIGLAGGVFIGMMAYSDAESPNAVSNTVNRLSNLRKPATAAMAGAVKGLRAVDPLIVKGVPPPVPVPVVHQRKALFLQYQPEIGTKGAFSQYPKDGLVTEDHDFSAFTAPGGHRFAEWTHGDSPYTYEKGESDALARTRRAHVKKAMQFAWQGYETYAFGMDEVMPETLAGHNNWGGFGTTLVDSLDTLWLMDMKDEFGRARNWVKNSLNNNRGRMVSVFETTIRSLGGLLSAYDWSGDEVFLEQAQDLGKRLFAAVEANPIGIPYGQVNLATGEARNIGWTGDNAIISEFGTLQIEFRLLARLTGNHDYKDKIEHVFTLLNDMNPAHGLYSYFVRNRGVQKPQFANDKLTFGAMTDSLYEYMLKVWIQGGKEEDLYREMYDKSIQGMHDELLQVSSPSGLVFIADKNNGRLDTKMDHLVCFMGGLLALGAYTDPHGLNSERAQRDLKTAKVRRLKMRARRTNINPLTCLVSVIHLHSLFLPFLI
jgi:hypothetical protein